MIAMTLGELADAVGGTLADADPGLAITGSVEIDSRNVTPGGLFVALPGERVDGHDFAAAAVDLGATAVLAQRPVGVPAIVVDDPVRALGRLAARVLAGLPDLTVVGVTGSSGKTSTKDLLAQVLDRLGPVVAPVGSFNNDIGLPLTVLRADGETRHLVLEYSARGPGHIGRLTGVAPPHVAIELNVGVAHLGEFGSQDVIATSKAELVAGLRPDGLAVLNADDPRVIAMRDVVPDGGRVVTFGFGDADVTASGVELDDDGRATFTLRAGGESARVSLRLYGEHHVGNALAVAATATSLGLPLSDTAEALSGATTVSRWRMEVTERPDGVTVVNDAYNANPDSMRAALKALAGMGRGGARRTWAVLGGMAELGPDSPELHQAVGRLAVRLNVARLVAVGPDAAQIHAGAVLEGSWGGESAHVADSDAAVALLQAELAPGDVVLVKASRAERLERVAAELLAQPVGGRA